MELYIEKIWFSEHKADTYFATEKRLVYTENEKKANYLIQNLGWTPQLAIGIISQNNVFSTF